MGKYGSGLEVCTQKTTAGSARVWIAGRRVRCTEARGPGRRDPSDVLEALLAARSRARARSRALALLVALGAPPGRTRAPRLASLHRCAAAAELGGERLRITRWCPRAARTRSSRARRDVGAPRQARGFARVGAGIDDWTL